SPSLRGSVVPSAPLSSIQPLSTAGLLAIARKLFGVLPNAAWIPSSSSFASPVAVVGSIGGKRGMAAPFVGDATDRRRLEWSCLDATSHRRACSCPRRPLFCLFG